MVKQAHFLNAKPEHMAKSIVIAHYPAPLHHLKPKISFLCQ